MSSHRQRLPAFPKKVRPLRLPLAIFAIALSLQTLHIVWADWGVLLQSPYPVSDAYFYLHDAWYSAFVNRDGGYVGQFIAFSPYVHILTWAYRLFGPAPSVPLFVNAVLMSGAIAFCATLTRDIFGELAGWCTGLLGAFCGLLIFFAGLTVKTSLEVALLSAGLYLLGNHFRHSSKMSLFLATLCLTVAALDRYNFIAVLLAMALVVFVPLLRTVQPRRIANATLAMGSAVTVVIALLSVNYGVAEQRFIASVGVHFYVGNGPRSWGAYTSIPGIRDDLIGARIDPVRVAQGSVGRSLSSWEMLRYWVMRSVDYYRAHGGAYLILQARKLGMLYAQGAQGQPEEYRVWRWRRPALMVAIVDMGMISALASLGIVLLWPRRREPMLAMLMLSYLLYAGSLWLLFVTERYRVPMIFLMLPIAGYACAEIITSRSWSRRALLSAVFVSLYAVSLFLNELNAGHTGWSADVLVSARMEGQRLAHEMPIYRLKQAAIENPSPEVWTTLATEFERRHYHPDSDRFAERAIAMAPDEPPGYRALFDIFRMRHDRAGLESLRQRVAAQAQLRGPAQNDFILLLHNMELSNSNRTY